MKQNIKNRVRNVLSHDDARLVAKDKGFTIIEVALVLAIAGLIFLVVFIAWPALQNSQKDTAARQDVNHVVTAIESFKTDHQGSLPSDTNGDSSIISQYVTSNNTTGFSTAKDGVTYSTVLPTAIPTPGSKTAVYYDSYVTCSGASAPSTVAVWIMLSSGTIFCQNAQ